VDTGTRLPCRGCRARSRTSARRTGAQVRCPPRPPAVWETGWGPRGVRARGGGGRSGARPCLWRSGEGGCLCEPGRQSTCESDDSKGTGGETGSCGQRPRPCWPPVAVRTSPGAMGGNLDPVVSVDLGTRGESLVLNPGVCAHREAAKVGRTVRPTHMHAASTVVPEVICRHDPPGPHKSQSSGYLSLSRRDSEA